MKTCQFKGYIYIYIHFIPNITLHTHTHIHPQLYIKNERTLHDYDLNA